MEVPRRSQLEWVHRNRQTHHRTARIGSVIPGLLGSKLGANIRHREEVRDCLGRLVDDTFREFCTLGPVDKHRVEIIVSDPTVAAGLRQQWLFHLVERLDRNCRFAATPKIRFRPGRGGDPLPQPGTDQRSSPTTQEAPGDRC